MIMTEIYLLMSEGFQNKLKASIKNIWFCNNRRRRGGGAARRVAGAAATWRMAARVPNLKSAA